MPDFTDFDQSVSKPARILRLSDVYRLKYLQDQPNFPSEDLTASNAEFLTDTLPVDPGIDRYASTIATEQRTVYELADKALSSIGIKTNPGPASLHAFSHGFASFDTICDLLHGELPAAGGRLRTYRARDLDYGVARVGENLIDLRPSAERTETHDDFMDSITQAIPELMRVADGEWKDPVSAREEERQAEFDLVDTQHPGDMPVTPAIAQFLAGSIRQNQAAYSHHLPDAGRLFTDRHDYIADNLPTTFDTLVQMGYARRETAEQITMRLAGASLAHSLQSIY